VTKNLDVRAPNRRPAEVDPALAITFSLSSKSILEGMAVSFENVLKRTSDTDAQGSTDQSALIRKLDLRQRKTLELF